MSRHRIVTRFAVPRPRPGTAELYRDRAWLEGRLELFRRYYVPSVSRLGIPAMLLCAEEVADFVAERTADLAWARVVAQDEWTDGYIGERDEILTRLDSDDAVHPGWFRAVEEVPAGVSIAITRDFLRWDPRARRLHRYRRREPAPLAAFFGGSNPYAVDHKHLATLDEVHEIEGPLLLQVVHGGNVKNRPLKPWRLDRRAPRHLLDDFAVSG